jgi:hypothetical protein
MRKHIAPLLLVAALVLCVGLPLFAVALGLVRDLSHGAKIVWLPPGEWGFGTGVVKDALFFSMSFTGPEYHPLYRYQKRGFYEAQYSP